MKYQVVKLNTARNSLRYIVNAFNIKEIYLPYYICPVVRNVLNKENCRIVFYNIDLNFKPKQDFPKNAFILYPNYFGVCSSIVEELSLKYKSLIVDNAHSFFSEPKGIASFNSLRKFFNQLRDGSFLYIVNDKVDNYQQDDYSYFFSKMTEEEFILNENRLDNEDIKLISKATYSYFSLIDLNEEKQRLKNHFEYYHKKYGSENLLKIDIKSNEFPFKYPLLLETVEKANIIVKELSAQGINVYRYWNNLPDNFEEKAFYERLVCI